MSSPTPFLVVPAVAWTVVAGLALIASVVLSVRARRADAAAAPWDPFGVGFPVAAVAAVGGYAVGAVTVGRFSTGAAAFGVLWPAMAAMALVHVLTRCVRVRPTWAGPVFAAVGAALHGSLPG
ncbi:hypothetical protein ACIQGO_11425 [Streptomyces shenzhenensis]|uniref:hypothetical protein n=1 Tax=Streptomyces shenzhenensis TaxID=943815 RepID=UPI0038082AD6